MRQRTRARNLNAYFSGMNGTAEARRVLVVMDGGIGNAIEATPLVQAIRSFWPRAAIDLLTVGTDLFRDWCVIDGCPSVEESRQRDYTDTFLAMYGRTEHVNPERCGRLHRPKQSKHEPFVTSEIECNMEMIRSLGFSGTAPPMYANVRRPDFSLPDTPAIISVVPGGRLTRGWRNKKWPYYGQLITMLLEQIPHAAVLIHGSDDDVIPDELPETDRIKDLRGLGLAETAWVFKHSTLVITNDCGPMHLADAVLARTIALFGPTCPLKNGPRYRGTVLQNPVPCSPCEWKPGLMTGCNNPVCMTGLSPESVTAKAVEILNQQKCEASQ